MNKINFKTAIPFLIGVSCIGNISNSVNAEIISKEDVKERISRKFILPSDEDIQKMDIEELLEQIKNYDSDIIDMITNMEIINNQIFSLERQIKLIESQKNIYLKEKEKIETKVDKDSKNLNKIKALLVLPTITLNDGIVESIEDVFNENNNNENFGEKIESNSESLLSNYEYKKKHLSELKKLKEVLDRESQRVNETKAKVQLRIEEINRRNIATTNPYGSQGTNVSIPSNIDSSELIRRIIDITAQQIGIPYVWGGATPNGFDCSGLLKYSFGQAGVSIPRVARDQQKASRKISYEELRPGDLVFWNYPATHVALYIGEGKIIESPRTGLNVRSRYIKPTEKGINYGRILE